MPSTSTRRPDAPSRARGRIRQVVDLGGCSLLEVELADGSTVTSVVDTVANRAAARVAAAGLRGVAGVDVVLHQRRGTAQLLGATRTPVRRPIGVGAALALVAAGAPGFVSLEVPT